MFLRLSSSVFFVADEEEEEIRNFKLQALMHSRQIGVNSFVCFENVWRLNDICRHWEGAIEGSFKTNQTQTWNKSSISCPWSHLCDNWFVCKANSVESVPLDPLKPFNFMVQTCRFVCQTSNQYFHVSREIFFDFLLELFFFSFVES